MRTKMNRIAPLLAVGAAAVAIAAAPLAAAVPTGTTNGTGSANQSPGNVEITAVPGQSAHNAAQLQQPFGGDMDALIFHHGRLSRRALRTTVHSRRGSSQSPP